MKPRVLVVDDETTLRAVIARNLEARGYEVVEVGTAREASEALAAQRFDLMFLDINLPDLTGWEFLRRLPPETRAQLPTVVLSASPLASGRVVEFEPWGVLQKPFPMEALLRMAAEATARPSKELQYG